MVPADSPIINFHLLILFLVAHQFPPCLVHKKERISLAKYIASRSKLQNRRTDKPSTADINFPS